MRLLKPWHGIMSAIFIMALSSASALASDIVELEQEELANGLKVVYVPVEGANAVHVLMAYHVGSKNEQFSRQGFAHMFEHMMFRGSAHVPNNGFIEAIHQVGGDANAHTSADATIFTSKVPANQLELPLYLEADRLAGFVVKDSIFDIERNVVGEELRLRGVSQHMSETGDLFDIAYCNHSYRWETAGRWSHLLAAQPSELQEFFNRYYVPNNAVLVICGRFEKQAAQNAVHKYFAWIPRGTESFAPIPQEPPQVDAKQGEVYRPISLPRLLIGWHVPGMRSPEYPALKLLAHVMGTGKSSRLYRQLVSTDAQCASVETSVAELEDPTLLVAGGIISRFRGFAQSEKVIFQTGADIAATGITQEELDTAKMQERVLRRLQQTDVEALATALAKETLFNGNAENYNLTTRRLDAVTRADVQAVAAKYIQPFNSTTLRIKLALSSTPLKPEPPRASASESQIVKPRVKQFPADWPEKTIIAKKERPEALQQFFQKTINNMTLQVKEDHRVPLVHWELLIRGGSESEAPGKEGSGLLTERMVQCGVDGMDESQWHADMESHGIRMTAKDHGKYICIAGICPSESTQYAVSRCGDLLSKPTFSSEAFAKLRLHVLDEMRVNLNLDTVVMKEIRTRLIPGHPLIRVGTLGSVAALKIEDIRDYFANTYRPDGAFLIVSGDITPPQAIGFTESLLSRWPQGAPQKASYPPAENPHGAQIILMDVGQTDHSAIYIGLPAFGIESNDKYAGMVANQLLSGDTDSKLGRILREEKGFTYGISAGFIPDYQAGLFLVRMKTSPLNVIETIELTLKILEDQKEQIISSDENEAAKMRLILNKNLGLYDNDQLDIVRLDDLYNQDHHLSPFYLRDQYANVTPEAVRDLFRKYIVRDRMVVVVYGSAQQLKTPLQAFGHVEVMTKADIRARLANPPTRNDGTPAK